MVKEKLPELANIDLNELIKQGDLIPKRWVIFVENKKGDEFFYTHSTDPFEVLGFTNFMSGYIMKVLMDQYGDDDEE